ncbi:MAG: hypothetical protein QXR64_08625 [Pyrobaculum sp.]
MALQQVQDPLSRFNVRFIGDGSPFSHNLYNALVRLNQTALLPIQNVEIVVRANPCNYEGFRCGAVTKIDSARSRIVVEYDPSSVNDERLAVHEAVHIHQFVARRLYGGGAEDELAIESFAEAVARWLTNRYRYDPARAREVARELLQRRPTKIEDFYKYYTVWDIREGDLRPKIIKSLDRQKFEQMLKELAGELERQQNNNQQNQNRNVGQTSDGRTKNDSQDKNRNIGAEGRGNVIIPEQIREVNIDNVKREDLNVPLNPLIREYASSSGKYVVYAPIWEALDGYISMAWLFDVDQASGMSRIRYRCIRRGNEWDCKEYASIKDGIPVNVCFPVQVVHRGNVVLETRSCELRGSELDLRHGQGRPWELLNNMREAQRSGSGNVQTSVLPFGHANVQTSAQPPTSQPQIPDILRGFEQAVASGRSLIQNIPVTSSVSATVGGVVNTARNVGTNIASALSGAVGSVGNVARDVGSNVVNVASAQVSNMANVVGNAIANAINRGADAVRNVASTVTQVVSNPPKLSIVGSAAGRATDSGRNISDSAAQNAPNATFQLLSQDRTLSVTRTDIGGNRNQQGGSIIDMFVNIFDTMNKRMTDAVSKLFRSEQTQTVERKTAGGFRPPPLPQLKTTQESGDVRQQSPTSTTQHKTDAGQQTQSQYMPKPDYVLMQQKG